MATANVERLIAEVSTYITNTTDINNIKEAFDYAKKMHEGQYRKSGDEYIVHPLDVAMILSEYQTDPTTIMAGLLHDVLEDTPATFSDVKQQFGEDVALLIEGVTKLGQYKFKETDHEKAKIAAQAKNYQKMLLAMSRDIRVVIVKLADRLNNIRTLGALPPEKQQRIARETMDIYAPLAHRLGMYVMKAELEDTCFKYLQNHKYRRIAQLIADTKHNREKDLKMMQTNIDYLLSENNIQSNVMGRIKNIYSVHKKMVDRNKEFEDIYDLLALRIIVDSIEDCYRTIGIIHSKWTPIPNRFKDYIAMPKPNLYQSLHTSVIANGKVYEIQIRTEEMDHIAEYGVAAHWAYKENVSPRKMTDEVMEKLKWYGDLVKFTKESDNDSDVVNLLRDDIFNSNVYVFTPNGDIIDLPAGSTPLDFAFRIHTQVGIETVGAIVNGKIVPLEYELKTGDIVNMKTSVNSFGPNDNWLKIVKTSNARSKIKSYLNKKRRSVLIEMGREDFQRELQQRNAKVELNDKKVKQLFSKKGAKTIDDLYFEIGKNTISPGSAVNALVEKEEYTEEDLIQRINESVYLDQKSDTNIIVEGLQNPSIKLSNCCTPIPGDPITGYISKGTGIAVHRRECNNLKALDKKRYIDVFWGNDNTKQYSVNLRIIVQNRDNVLAEIINTVTSNQGKVIQVAASTNRRLEGIIKLKVSIKNRKELQGIIRSLQNISDVFSIERMMK
ncbi:RelA/SpoT family protein [Candidatus Xianfuyuplasma coldseepsis]|uniref:Penta-phosphate guanosine-3'-pyrophosphohydrolase n=1 Tax=Candidatus Xianfuyuplasma coldseepsis TaxID=2782163 RepID=A0A7L7KUB7_9MOLU|nr:bifunctional (p)ppGpp synthetase/guanosine-3',5'-bis(diphosphate) 3'-pyrophosphohydrolase [Xianfuyuplasma coldseepsis]QMS85892.1 bifunctional (p)ppGpp synthetase/guanosine-3',5'-bis(diphosphate) 3'-pyrophosphohydrolase [Xianfuyuplasma coldseepsis]